MNNLLDIGIEPLIFAGIFLGVLLAFEGFRQILSRSESTSEAKNRRMKMIAGGATTKETLRLLNPKSRTWPLTGIPFIGKLPATLRQAGIIAKPGTFLTICIFLTVVISVLASAVVPIIVAVGFALVICFLAPMIFINIKKNSRLSALERQLPDALDLMARGLIVGHPLNTTVASVAEELSDPIASEFGTMIDQISFGDDLVDAFMDFSDRTDVEDVRYMAVSVAIQNGTGGDLAQILQTLASVIRDRRTMRKRVLAISSEGRLTSIFLSFLPVFIFATTSFSSPEYYSGVSDDPLFRPFALTIGFLVVANYLILRRLVNFKF
ncbi:MAG: type II secretion system F family protein [Paracoccaceae bacterium]